MADKSLAGYIADIRDQLQKYDASKLSQVDPKNCPLCCTGGLGWTLFPIYWDNVRNLRPHK